MRILSTQFLALLLFAPSAFGATAARVIPGANIKTGDSVPTQSATVTRNNNSAVVSRSATVPNKSRTAATAQSVVSRAPVARNTNTTDARAKLDAAVSTVGRNSRVSSASINNNPTVRRMGLSLRPTTAEVGGRATISGTETQTGSNMDAAVRSVSARAGALEQFAPVREQMENINELHSICRTQYAQCMDMFCNVVDDTMGRCSCSSNYSDYNRVARAATNANAELNEVAQRIRYIGLTPEEIEVMNTGTVAEEEMASTVDKSDMAESLKDIAAMIKNPSQISSAYSAENTDILDIDLTFSSDLVDLSGVNIFSTTESNTSVSNKRGTALYDAAKNHCKHILTQCVESGADAEQITANYDIDIDKDCMSYAATLEKQNENIRTNIRSAETMLQSARTAVAQNKNIYDTKNCAAALNACMTDDYVCGSNYYNCVDPTNGYIDASGEIVLGHNPRRPLVYMAQYSAAEIDEKFLMDAYAMKTVSDSECANVSNNNGRCIANKLLKLIGMGASDKEGGVCRHVLDQCQQYTYNKNNVYNPYNEVVLSYMRYAMSQIHNAQQKIVGDYTASCVTDVKACVERQVGYINAWGSEGDIEALYNVVRGACRNIALSCGFATFDYTDFKSYSNWDGSDFTMIDPNSGNATAGCDVSHCENESCKNNEYITCIAKVALQESLCPANSTFTSDAGTPGVDNYVNAYCVCDTGYAPDKNTGYCY